MTRDEDDPPLDWERPAPVPPAALRPEPPASLTVSQVSARVQGALLAEFPRPFWITGETVAVRPHKAGHLYFTLVDDEITEAAGRPSLQLKVWASTARKLFGPRGRAGRAFRLADGLVVRLLVRPDWWPPGGQVSFIVEDIDPDHTLGKLDRLRRELLERLSAQGALERNRAVPLPEVPLTIGLVSSHDSAAWNDVLRTLRESEFGFRVLSCDARMQGENAARQVCAALATLARRGVDCIVLARGGGSRVDLAWFDREDIARAIADCPVPVLTGIGHEIDTSVADLVAHRAFRTPTAVAEFLVGAARAAREATERSFADLLATVEARLQAEREDLLGLTADLRRAVRERDRAETDALRLAARELRASCERRLNEQAVSLAEARARLERGPHVERLGLAGAALAADTRRLTTAAFASVDRHVAALEGAEVRARLLDPAAVLRRGYALLRRADGTLLKQAADAVRDEPLVALLRDGELDLRAGAARGRPLSP